jgi:hypothetical protein
MAKEEYSETWLSLGDLWEHFLGYNDDREGEGSY